MFFIFISANVIIIGHAKNGDKARVTWEPQEGLSLKVLAPNMSPARIRSAFQRYALHHNQLQGIVVTISQEIERT